MSRAGSRILVVVGAIAMCIAIAGWRWVGARWQSPDLAFDVSVSRPAFTRDRPRVLLDEAHRDFHRTTGTFSPFVALLRNDGFEVDANARAFTRESLAASASALASRFGVEMSTGRAFDETRFDSTRNSPSRLEFSADAGALPAVVPCASA